MSTPLYFNTPKEALREMLVSGARFAIHRRKDTLGIFFSYTLVADGDPVRCHAILAHVKGRPAQFLSAFKEQVHLLSRGATNA